MKKRHLLDTHTVEVHEASGVKTYKETLCRELVHQSYMSDSQELCEECRAEYGRRMGRVRKLKAGRR